MAIHEFACRDFIGKNLQLKEKMFLLGGNNKLAEIYLTYGTLFFDYRIVVINTVPLTCFFEDEEGDRYSLICLLSGKHSTNFNSTNPNIIKCYFKGDELEKYNDLRLSSNDIFIGS